ncbi:MAG: FAD-dependent oxidoreductase [Thiotrichales bacterium]|nr:FAD-dependent oxidoreductase [Thiotrichales bacterium]
MKSHVRVAVIGGGVVGCSVLYHLVKHGWKDVVLLERSELTSGSTWHAAGGMHTINSDPNVAKLQDYTLKLYKEIEEVSGQSCGIHLTGGLMLADTRDRLDYLETARSRGRYLGLDTEFIDLQEAARMLPIMDPKHYVGVLYDPNEGHVDPSGVTHAYAGAARKGGAEVYRETRVTDLAPRADGTWDVVTDKGTVHAEHVVNAAGLWAREVGLMAGVMHPFTPMEHQYVITDEVPEVADSKGEMLHAIDFGGGLYMRQEGRGVLLGTYERHGRPWSERTTPWDFGHELLPDDLDRIGDNLMRAFERFPALEKAGLKQVINGPFTFTPDGNPLVGPVPEVRNYWAACGVLAGFSQGGGVGLALARWMIDGDPGMDAWAMDVARFGDYAGPAYSRAMARQTYATRFLVPFPNEERPAGRPLRRTPIHDRLKAKGAVFGAAFGLEQALWYAPEGAEPVETPTFRRSNAHGPVGEECRAVREGVGITETSGFGKYEITGPGAELWLGRLLANRIPREGRMVLSPMLNPRGTIIGDFTLAKLGPERFLILGSGPAEAYHLRWFRQHLPDDGVSLRSLRTELVGLSIAGPKARELLVRVTTEDVSNEAFRFMAIRPMEIGLSPALVGRITFTGDLGYEIWMKPDYQLAVYDTLLEAGEDLDLRHFGSRALNSLRLEKGFGSFTREYTPDYTPFQAGLERFVDLRKNDFIGRDALIEEQQTGPARKRVIFRVDANGVDALANEPVLCDGETVGWVTSGGFCHHLDASIALGYVPSALAERTGGFRIEILGEMRDAVIVPEPPFDPDGARMRS